jgi:hypothetical protein
MILCLPRDSGTFGACQSASTLVTFLSSDTGPLPSIMRAWYIPDSARTLGDWRCGIQRNPRPSMPGTRFKLGLHRPLVVATLHRCRAMATPQMKLGSLNHHGTPSQPLVAKDHPPSGTQRMRATAVEHGKWGKSTKDRSRYATWSLVRRYIYSRRCGESARR